MSRRRVLLDENLPARLRRSLPSVEAVSAEFMGWKGVRNGELVRRALAERFEVLVTADRALAWRPRAWAPLGCVFVTPNDFASLRAVAAEIEAACLDVVPGQVVTVVAWAADQAPHTRNRSNG
jgi:predicted nuclease of predicted toxin-antitoxin system